MGECRNKISVLVSCVMLSLVIGGAPAEAVRPAVIWDSTGSAEIEAPPFILEFEFADYTKPSQIRTGALVHLDVYAEIDDSEVCGWQLTVTALHDGEPVGTPVNLSGEDYFDDDDGTLRIPVERKGTYTAQVEGFVFVKTPGCYEGGSTRRVYQTSIELFDLKQNPEPAASKAKVIISSSGSHTLYASTRGRSSSIRIIYTITDKENREKLNYSICMDDEWDCWFEDSQLKPSSSVRKTSTGWIKTWDYYWERVSPSTCFSYYWNEPTVSVLLIVSNADGKNIGRKKHYVRLTCRQ